MRIVTWTAALALLATGMFLGTFPGTSVAQEFPNRFITLVVPYPPGGATEVAVRPIIDRMAAALGQPIVVENVSGAGSTLGTARVARASPDGYTILAQQVSLAAMPALFRNLTFDAEKSLTGIGLINTNPSVIVGRASLASKDFRELTAWIKSNSGQTRVAHAGAGTMAHLCAVAFAKAIDAEVNLIPYRGGNAVNTDLLGGHVDLFCSGAGLVLEHIKSGGMRAYAVTSKSRYAPLPDTPTVFELGHPELEIEFWNGLFAPAGTPAPVIARLNAALRYALADPGVVKTFEASGMDVFPPEEQTPEAATKLWLTETKRWGDVIRANNITITP